MAGLSHALTASGFHLSMLLGSVPLLSRRLPPGLQLPLAAIVLLLIVCLAGAQPSVVRAGRQRWQLFLSPQALWTLQELQRSASQQFFTGTWLGFKPSAQQRRCLLQHGAGSRFIGL